MRVRSARAAPAPVVSAKRSPDLPVLAVHRLLGDTQERADLGPAQAHLASTAYGNFLALGQLLTGFSDGGQLTHNAIVTIIALCGSHAVSIR
jgi:hypothetical protein